MDERHAGDARDVTIAFVNQPWNPFLPPVQGGSIAIWNDRVARVLAGDPATRVVLLGGTKGSRMVSRTDGRLAFRAVPLRYGPKLERWRARLGLDRDPRSPRLLSPSVYASFARRVLRVAVAEDPRVLHVHNLAQLLPIARTLLPRARLVLHMHCEWLSQLDAAWMYGLARHADAIVGCSEHVTATIRAAHPGLAARCFAVPNGVDVVSFTPRPAPRGERRIVLFVGRISPEKGLHVLLPAFARLCAERGDLELHIAGPDATTPQAILVDLAHEPRVRALARWYEGDYLAALRARAAPLGDRVRFLGAVPQDQLPDCYARASVVVQPSLYESFGMPIIEAMACERAVVACRAGGMTELVDDGEDGLLVEPDDPVALADALAALLDDDARRTRLAAAGLRKARARFAWEHVAHAVRAVHDGGHR